MDFTDPRYFSITDTVEWDRSRYPTLLPHMISRFGEGPFRVVGLRLHLPGVKTVSPVAVTITVPNRNEERQELAGEWFKKVE